ncbi:MAG: SMI1/KNR4 family protein [Planctomycetaceae bacterium]|nr:SMI1/KNR4 family protein [Planctomycetaceae bacterium]
MLHDFRFSGPNSQLSERDITTVIDRFGESVASDYLNFLRHRNGGCPVPSLVSSIPILNEFPIQYFYCLTEPGTTLFYAYESLQESLDVPDLLPIALDMAGQQICLQLDSSQPSIFVVYIDRIYYKDPSTVEFVCASFSELVNSLSQPAKAVSELEVIAALPWAELQAFIVRNPGYYLASRPDELSLLCQTIRCNNTSAFDGLLQAGADREKALMVAVICNRLDIVRTLIGLGSRASDVIRYAVGPDRKELREYLSKHA